MSSVHVDEQLFQQTVAIAAAQGKTVDQFVGETLQQVVGQAVPQAVVVRRSTRNGLPVMIVNGTVAAINPDKVRKSIEEDGF